MLMMERSLHRAEESLRPQGKGRPSSVSFDRRENRHSDASFQRQAQGRKVSLEGSNYSSKIVQTNHTTVLLTYLLI